MALPNFNTLHKFILFPEPSTSNTPLFFCHPISLLHYTSPALPPSEQYFQVLSKWLLTQHLLRKPLPLCTFLQYPLFHFRSILLWVTTISSGLVGSKGASVICRSSLEDAFRWDGSQSINYRQHAHNDLNSDPQAHLKVTCASTDCNSSPGVRRGRRVPRACYSASLTELESSGFVGRCCLK